MQQLPETILLDDVVHTLYTTPLLPWLRAREQPIEFDWRTNACERGYIGNWKIDGDRLWLVGLHAWRDGEFTKVASLFDGKSTVWADWFTGPLVIEPTSDAISVGAELTTITLLVEKGVVVSKRQRSVTRQ